MKIIKDTPDRSEPTRMQWVEAFLAHFKPPHDPREISTSYRDGGAAIRFRFVTGAEAEWRWQKEKSAEAAQEAISAGLVLRSSGE